MRLHRKFATLATLSTTALCACLLPTHVYAACDATTIAGSYGFRLHEFAFHTTSSSTILPAGTSVPGSFVGQIVFNSADRTVTGFRMGNGGGVPIPSEEFNTSTYSVNSDCTGTLTLLFDDRRSATYGITIVLGGAEIEFAETSSSSALVSSGDAKRQPVACDAATIAGDFGVRFDRLLAPPGQAASGSTFKLEASRLADSGGHFHFEPTTTSEGSVSGHLAGITGGTEGFSSEVSGPYSVTSNCTGTVKFIDSEGETKELGMTIVGDAANPELEFANVTQPVEQIVGEGVGKKQ